MPRAALRRGVTVAESVESVLSALRERATSLRAPVPGVDLTTIFATPQLAPLQTSLLRTHAASALDELQAREGFLVRVLGSARPEHRDRAADLLLLSGWFHRLVGAPRDAVRVLRCVHEHGPRSARSRALAELARILSGDGRYLLPWRDSLRLLDEAIAAHDAGDGVVREVVGERLDALRAQARVWRSPWCRLKLWLST